MLSAYNKRIRFPATPRNPKSISAMFLAVAPLGTTFLRGTTAMAALSAVLLGIMALALWLITEGQKRHEAYDATKTAHAPRFKRKIMGSALIGGVVLTVSFVNSDSVINAILMGVIGTILSLVAFGPDPLQDKGLETMTDLQGHSARRITTVAHEKLATMEAKITALQDIELTTQFHDFRVAGMRMLNAVENDPARRRSLRKYIGLYLDAAGQATDRFAGLYAHSPTQRAKQTYMDFLRELSEQFHARTSAYAETTQDQLDLEIGLLRDRLRQEARD